MDDSILHGIFWNHLVYPELASDEVADPAVMQQWIQQRLPEGVWPDYAACLCVDGLDEAEMDARREAIQHIRSTVQDLLAEHECWFLGFAHTNTLYFCGQPSGDPSDLASRLDELLKRLAESHHPLVGTVGLAFLPEESIAALQWAAQYAIVAQRQKVRTGSGRLYVYDPASPPDSLDLKTYWELAKRMQSVIRAGDIPAVEESLNDLTDALFRKTYLPLSHMRPILQSQVIFMAQAAMEAMVDARDVAEASERFLSRIGTAYDYARLRDMLREAAHCFGALVHHRYESQTTRLVSAVEDFIAANLCDEDLSLQAVSRHLGASPAHISRMYKKEKGVGMARSIQARRVEHAQRLLLDRGNSILDIARDSGFASVQHFGRVFKEITGCTPSDWRTKRSGSSAKSV